MDELDREIISFLRQDGRMRYTKIAEELDVAEGTVRNRVARLQDEKAIQIIGMTDPHRMGYEAPAMIGISIQMAWASCQAIAMTSPRATHLGSS